jgi:hypothetical protein
MVKFWAMGKNPMAQQFLVGQGLLIVEASWSHTDTSHLVGLLWTSDQPDAETCTRQQTALTRDNHAPAVFEPAIPISEEPKTHALDRAATGIGKTLYINVLQDIYGLKDNKIHRFVEISPNCL